MIFTTIILTYIGQPSLPEDPANRYIDFTLT